MTPADAQRELTRERPFPGPQPYREVDGIGRDRFFRGRSLQTAELARLVQRNSLAVLFGASGVGKSSLIAAGLFPLLRERGHLPLIVSLKYLPDDEERTGSSTPSGAIDLPRQIMAGVRRAVAATRHEEDGAEAGTSAAPASPSAPPRQELITEHAEDCSTLWEFFHRLEIWTPELELCTPVVVLDQFEESFILSAQSAATRAAVIRLFEAIGDVVENRVPPELATQKFGLEESAPSQREPALLGALGDIPENSYPANPRANVSEHAYLAFTRRAPVVRILISLREEYLPHLEELRRQMPALLRNRMRLLPFKGDEAARAIAKSAPHLVTTEVAAIIVRAISGRRALMDRAHTLNAPALAEAELESLEIEPSLLNLFCYQLNERRIRGVDGRRPERIEASLVSSTGANILRDFYRDCLEGMNARVQHFVEEALVSATGFRLSVPLHEVHRAIGKPTASELIRRRLVRQESRANNEYLQLVHDVLTQPIVESRRQGRADRLKGRLIIASGVAGIAILIVLFFLFKVKTGGDRGLADLYPKLAAAQSQYDSARALSEQAQSEFARVSTELNQSQAELAQARFDRQQSERLKQAALDEAAAARQQKNDAELSAARVRATAEHAQREAAEAAEARQRAEAERAEIERQADALRAEREKVERAIDLLKKQGGIPRNPG